MNNNKDKKFYFLLIEISNYLNLRNKLKWVEIGCGNGNFVNFLLKNNKKCIGIDVEFKVGPYREKLMRSKYIKKISSPNNNRDDINENNKKYKWPINKETTELAFSSSVLEHVKNLREFASENSRILIKGGYSIHYFPCRLAIFEAHTGIPLGGIFINKTYYRFMIFLGLCRKNFKNTNDAYQYMKKSTNYLKKSEIIKIFSEFNLIFLGARNDLIIKHVGPKFYKNFAKINFIVFLFGIFRSRLLIFKKI